MHEAIIKANEIVNLHETRNPFKIAKYEGFIIKLLDFDEIKGYYSKILDKKFIFINQNLDELSKHIVCAHELGHGILHDIKHTYFMREYTLFPVHSKIEKEANIFAAELIISDTLEYDSFYKDGISLNEDVLRNLLEIKLFYRG